MRKRERQDHIEERLRREKKVLIKDLSEDLSVSLITLRRDFDEMEQRGLLKKTQLTEKATSDCCLCCSNHWWLFISGFYFFIP